MTKKSIKFIFLFSLLFLSLLPAFLLLAAEERKLEVQYPEILGFKPETVKTGLPEYVRYVFNFVIILSGIIALAALIWGGFTYLTAAGRPDKLKDGKDRILSAFLGIIILLSSYLILVNINPQLVVFNLPPLTPVKKVEVAPIPEVKPEEISLIVTEIPLGQAIDKGLWLKENRTRTEELVTENENFLNQLTEIGSKKFRLISDLNKYLKSLGDECHCELLTDLCTKPKDCAREPDVANEKGCTGDPCPREVRENMGKVLGANQSKIQALLGFQKRILEKKDIFEKELSKFQNIEQEMLSCEEQTKLLFDLNEHLSRVNFYREQGWKLEALTLPGAPKSAGDPLTFYCSVGGTIFDYPYIKLQEIPSEISQPFSGVTEMPQELTPWGGLSCQVEFPVGEMIDEIRELAVLLIVKLERLAGLDEKLVSHLNKMDNLISECSDKNCKTDCKCVPSGPCGLAACSLPAGQALCLIPCFPVPGGCVPNPCFQQCSPCLQSVGGCTCAPGSDKCPCPRLELDRTVGDIKKTEDEIFETIRGIKYIFSRTASLLGEDLENPYNLKNLRQGLSLCFSPSIEEPTWSLMNCQAASESIGPDGQLIGNCNPRNFFCCSLSETQIKFPWKPPTPPREPVFSIPAKEFPTLPEGEKGCPQGWLCDPDVKKYNQYNDASQSLKELISCMRNRLDKTKTELELDQGLSLGRISSISDSKLYAGTCSWENGPTQLGGCSHIYEIKYGKERVSAHYGGPACRSQKQSYALDLADEENADYLIAAAKECRPDAFIIFRTPGHYDHLHISIGQAERCGGN